MLKINREKLLNSFQHPDDVYSLALQPGADGNVIATACDDGILRLFDPRIDEKGEFITSLLQFNIMTRS